MDFGLGKAPTKKGKGRSGEEDVAYLPQLTDEDAPHTTFGQDD